MTKYFIYLLVALGVVTNCFCNPKSNNENKQGLSDTTPKVVDINIAANALTQGMAAIDIFDLYQDTLFLINKDKLVQVNLKSGEVSANVKVNIFLAKQLKANKHVQQILVQDDCYYITLWNECYRLSKSGEEKKIYTNDVLISRINVVGSTVLIADQESIKIIDQNGKVGSSTPFVNFSGNNGFITSKDAIAYQAVPTDNIVEFKPVTGSKVEAKEYTPVLVKGVKEPFISYANNNNLIGFDYWKRNTVYVFKKGVKDNAVVKTINLAGFNYMPTVEEMKKEEGDPNFKIAYNKKMFYVIALWRGKLKITSFTM